METAENAKGEKVKQKFEFIAGQKMDGYLARWQPSIWHFLLYSIKEA